MKKILLRSATIDDLTFIVGIYNSVIPLRNVTADTEPVTVDSRISWFYEHTTARPLWIVEDCNRQAIGWVGFQNFYGRPAYKFTAEISIYLSPDQRGKGYGKKILSHCITNAPGLGIKTILGFIFSHNTISIKLFESQGFKCWGELPDVAVLDDVEKSLKIFGKRVDSFVVNDPHCEK